ncbi:MAG: hypothetical protein M3Y86_02765, partial [Verrucomicrobiota bacterium]|nr:hypothetical protein [Verrucomicrobiota bacterium]
VHLGAVDPQHVRVEAYYGEPGSDDISNVAHPAVAILDRTEHKSGNGHYVYEGSVPAAESGTYAFSVRVVPTHPHLMQAHELRLITWS